MKSIDRLFQYFDYKGIKPTAFERKCGLSNGYLSLTLKRKGDIGSKIVDTIINNCPDLSQEWLMMGKGQMIQEIKPNSEVTDSPQSEIEYLKREIQMVRELLKEKERLIEKLEPLADQVLKEMLERNKK